MLVSPRAWTKRACHPRFSFSRAAVTDLAYDPYYNTSACIASVTAILTRPRFLLIVWRDRGVRGRRTVFLVRAST